jgi:hypothetical protein
MSDLDPALEQKLADLSDVDWAALTARVRPPSSAAQLREIAGTVIDGDKLDAFVHVANVKAFATENGDLDEAKVLSALNGMFGAAPPTGPSHHDFGQYRPGPPVPGPGQRGAAEAAKRFGTDAPQYITNGHGAGGAAEAQRRFGGEPK